ncbi:hypothetical protein FRC12_021720 [Ceratobasidium sp. 428]|nr:hypothetical protein FRC12_021720 [Ceratobasidium sp. 428]
MCRRCEQPLVETESTVSAPRFPCPCPLNYRMNIEQAPNHPLLDEITRESKSIRPLPRFVAETRDADRGCWFGQLVWRVGELYFARPVVDFRTSRTGAI